MTDEELTALWREAGEPTCLGMFMDGCSNPIIEYIGGEPHAWNDEMYDSGLTHRIGDAPDWSHPMTEFAMMCAAEQALTSQRHPEANQSWEYGWSLNLITSNWEIHDCGATVFRARGTRIECALRVIIACRSGERGGA